MRSSGHGLMCRVLPATVRNLEVRKDVRGNLAVDSICCHNFSDPGVKWSPSISINLALTDFVEKNLQNASLTSASYVIIIIIIIIIPMKC